jgi:hypothetical protein
MNGSDVQRDEWRQFLEYHPELVDSVEDFDDVQPSREEVLGGEIKSPSALEGGGFRFGVYELVGHGKQTNHWCGTFGKFLACSRVELHNKVIFDRDGRLFDCRGKTDVHPVFRSCDKFSCPTCYERGASVREADNIAFRLEESAKRLDHVVFGDREHIIVSVDLKFWGWDEEKIRKYVLKGLKSRGVVGGCLIPHWARFDHNNRCWRLGVHYHVIGFIRGGFRKCRGCNHVNEKGSRFFCGGCDGFYGVSKKCWKSDRLIVEVKGKRESVFGTAWYQLHHATIRVDKRSHLVKWFGVCSYRKMKIPKEARKEYNEKRKPKCRICGSVMVRHEYCGHDLNVIAWFAKHRSAREKVERFFGLACDFVERPEKWGSGSYGEGR